MSSGSSIKLSEAHPTEREREWRHTVLTWRTLIFSRPRFLALFGQQDPFSRLLRHSLSSPSSLTTRIQVFSAATRTTTSDFTPSDSSITTEAHAQFGNKMAGPNLELFKFGMYLFFPLAVMVHYGDPEWYHRNVLPVSIPFTPPSLTASFHLSNLYIFAWVTDPRPILAERRIALQTTPKLRRCQNSIR